MQYRFKTIAEVFPCKWELRRYNKFKKEEGLGLNEVQCIVSFLRYFNANIKGVYFRKGSGRKAISKRTGIPEYQVQLIIKEFTNPDGCLPKLSSKYNI